jgi:hypothetical protein
VRAGVGEGQEAPGEERVGGWEEAGDAGGVEEAVCLRGGGYDGVVFGGGVEEEGLEAGIGVEVAGCEGPG